MKSKHNESKDVFTIILAVLKEHSYCRSKTGPKHIWYSKDVWHMHYSSPSKMSWVDCKNNKLL